MRHPWHLQKDEALAKPLTKGKLNNLHNKRPTWLDEPVFAASGWDPAISDEELLASLLELNFPRTSG